MKSNMYQQVYITFASDKIFSTFTSNLVIILTRLIIKTAIISGLTSVRETPGTYKSFFKGQGISVR